jgi:hypothetical protein
MIPAFKRSKLSSQFQPSELVNWEFKMDTSTACSPHCAYCKDSLPPEKSFMSANNLKHNCRHDPLATLAKWSKADRRELMRVWDHTRIFTDRLTNEPVILSEPYAAAPFADALRALVQGMVRIERNPEPIHHADCTSLVLRQPR